MKIVLSLVWVALASLAGLALVWRRAPGRA
jgi:hypothetical protein